MSERRAEADGNNETSHGVFASMKCMRTISSRTMAMLFLLALLCGGFAGVSGQEKKEPSTRAQLQLTPEQVAVYRAVLQDYTKENPGRLNLASRTERLTISESDRTCVQKLRLPEGGTSGKTSHVLPLDLAADFGAVLADAERQKQAIDENDPQNLMKRVLEKGERITDTQVKDAVDGAFAVGLFTLSEIAFDSTHRHAVVAYSFACGSLCGNGDTLILEKVGKEWRVARRCGGWVS